MNTQKADNIQKKVLLADDNPINREVVHKILETIGFTTESVSNGEEVLTKLYASDNYEILILDINMPNLNGLETAEIIRNSKDNKINKIPIIALTGNDTQIQINEIIESGINYHLAKPASPDKLKEIVLKAMNSNSTKKIQPDNQQEVCQHEIDIEQGLFFVGNDIRIFKKLLSRFHETYLNYMDKIFSLVDQNDIQNLQFAVHNLKGTSAQVCATKLHLQAKEFETKLKTNPDNIRKTDLQELDSVFQKTMDSIAFIIKSDQILP